MDKMEVFVGSKILKEEYEKYIKWMKEQDDGDVERSHRGADFVLKEFLRELGYDELVEAYEDIPKWYA